MRKNLLILTIFVKIIPRDLGKPQADSQALQRVKPLDDSRQAVGLAHNLGDGILGNAGHVVEILRADDLRRFVARVLISSASHTRVQHDARLKRGWPPLCCALTGGIHCSLDDADDLGIAVRGRLMRRTRTFAVP